MTGCPKFKYLLILPRLRIQNTNAISSPLTHGFPSITAFMGLMWALQRNTNRTDLDLKFNAIGVVCHDYQEQVTDDGFVKTFCLPRHPVEANGKTAPIIEEGRIHLDVSLVFAVTSDRWDQEPATRDTDMAIVAELLTRMRIASGTLLPPRYPKHPRYRPKILDLTGTHEDREKVFSSARRHLLPGFTLVSRPDLLETRLAELQTENPTATPLDAWLSFSRRQWRYQSSGHGKKGRWQPESRKGQGWIVPMPVGYAALDGLHTAGSVANVRDMNVPFCFVESLYSLGQWISPHRVHKAEDLLWYSDYCPKTNTYLCRNDYRRDSDDVESLYDDDY